MPSFVTHLESAIDGSHLSARTIQTTHNDRPLWVRYNLDAIGKAVTREDLANREPSLWRYRELLPIEDDDDVVSLGETISPLIRCDRLGEKLSLEDLLLKDESRLPTGSFKARGMALAVSMAKSLGIKRLALPTAGNAGGAAAAYAARAGMECFVFMPADTPIVNQYEARLFAAKAFLVDGLIGDCGTIVREGRDHLNWFDLSTLKEPYRIEGKKTMGLELAEQMGWNLPDAIFYPTGGGTGLIGMWKAFNELAELGWLNSEKRPKMFACQSTGCPPLPTAFEAGRRFATPPEQPHSIATGIRVPSAIGDFMILDAVRESDGAALAAEEQRLPELMRLAGESEGVSLCPEAAACIGGVESALKRGLISPSETIVIFNTGAAQKYVEAINTTLPAVNHLRPINWNELVEGGWDNKVNQTQQ